MEATQPKQCMVGWEGSHGNLVLLPALASKQSLSQLLYEFTHSWFHSSESDCYFHMEMFPDSHYAEDTDSHRVDLCDYELVFKSQSFS